uniref:Uncharacterized protein n=1 Tax=Arundo donax TaxID=35708 RepID=A0A0A9G355_ARUDO
MRRMYSTGSPKCPMCDFQY